MTANHQLRDEIREYWSRRSETFDLAFGHRIAPGVEADTWAQPMRDHLGPTPLRVLELACGTGEVTRLVHDLGHDVTALDFSEAMLAVARAKHAGKPRLRFLLADAGQTMEPSASYDAILCRHLVWTLTEPETAFADWFRLLRPGGRLLVYDGNWAHPSRHGRWAARALALWDRLSPDPNYDGALGPRHAAIMRQLPFAEGLTAARLTPMLTEAGFVQVTTHSHSAIARAQRRVNGLRNRLRTRVYDRFILTARKP
ncbi:class I SAM-dependent methyltransferase [Gemmobacter fulvus]|uniref:Class I SAM-dependent methyltransferase n=1 Tax=Gemmobacter fulvus TaxID=2840474 RepID=A0A975P4V9_9RHOB|nr:class I SAM-dependent methyltransferase [Gemmobacter fulvus]MBT9246733.1 class I SAM-dependent methyltransferase [Gemmobacter fulvus]QWK89163.1 class I SAM-dependent methyltransferase [Gemmobacter fulvus]